MRPMLAATVKDIRNLRFPLLASPKLDGVRAIVIDGHVLSRTMKLIPNQRVQELYGAPEFNGYDGELIVGPPTAPDCYRRTVSAVMTADDRSADVNFMVFDNFKAKGCFELRHQTVIPELRHAHTNIAHSDDLDKYETYLVDAGYEGVILRAHAGEYKLGRSTLNEQGMLKLKRFQDDEALVTGVEELMHNDNPAMLDERGYTKRTSHQANKVPMGLLGALVCTWNGKTMRIGSGFTAAERAEFWERDDIIGRVAKFKYLAVGMKDLPRHPVFLGWRV